MSMAAVDIQGTLVAMVGASASPKQLGAVAAALARAVLGAGMKDNEECEEIQAEVKTRLGHIQPVLTAKVKAGAAGVQPQIAGRLRAARNMCEHGLLGAGEEAIRHACLNPQSAQRGGNRDRKVQILELESQIEEMVAINKAQKATIEEQLVTIQRHEEKIVDLGKEGEVVQKEYAEWCEDWPRNVGFEIKTGLTEVESLKTSIAEDTSTTGSLTTTGSITTKDEELAVSLATGEQDLKAATKTCNKDMTDQDNWKQGTWGKADWKQEEYKDKLRLRWAVLAVKKLRMIHSLLDTKPGFGFGVTLEGTDKNSVEVGGFRYRK